MKTFNHYLMLLLMCAGCARQPSLPADSLHNVTSHLNDSTWYGTGKVLRLRKSGQEPGKVRKFNLVVFTDIDYPGFGDRPNPKTSNGCKEPECTRSQSLVIYNIPLKKRRYSISKLNSRTESKNEVAALSYIGNAGGLVNLYTHQKGAGWIRVTRIDKTSGIVEGRFDLLFNKQMSPKGFAHLPETARFSDGLFRIKITDVLLR